MTSFLTKSSDREMSFSCPADGRLKETPWFSGGRIFLVILLFAAPLAFGAVEMWAWATIVVASLLLLICWSIGCAQQSEVRIQWTPLYVPTALFLLLGVAQLLTHHTSDPIATREATIKLITDLLIFFLAGQLFHTASKKFWRGLGMAITLYTFSISTFAILQFFSQPDLIFWTVKPRWGGYVFGPYVNHNHYAGLMEMLVPMGASFVLMQTKGRPWRWMFGFAITLSLASVLLSGSRAGLISLLVESVIFGAVLLARSRTSGNRDLALASFAVSVCVALFVWAAPATVFGRFASIARSPEVTYGVRKQMTFDTMRMFRDHFWAGVGLGSFETSYTQYQSVLGTVAVGHAHNDFAEVVAETGFLGMLLVSASLLLFFIGAFRNSDSWFHDPKGWICFGGAVGCCGLICHSFADFNLHIPANAAWFAFSAGVTQWGFRNPIKKN